MAKGKNNDILPYLVCVTIANANPKPNVTLKTIAGPLFSPPLSPPAHFLNAKNVIEVNIEKNTIISRMNLLPLC